MPPQLHSTPGSGCQHHRKKMKTETGVGTNPRGAAEAVITASVVGATCTPLRNSSLQKLRGLGKDRAREELNIVAGSGPGQCQDTTGDGEQQHVVTNSGEWLRCTSACSVIDEKDENFGSRPRMVLPTEPTPATVCPGGQKEYVFEVLKANTRETPK